MSFFTNLIVGALLPFRAARLTITTPKLWPWVLLPLLVTVCGYYYLWADFFIPWERSIGAQSSDFLAGLFGIDSQSEVKAGLASLISVLLICLFWIVALFSFSSLSNLATLPFSDLLAEATETVCTPPLTHDYPGGVSAFLKAMWVDLSKGLASSVIMLVTFIFSWIPIMNIAALILVAFALTLQYSGFASTRRGLGVRSSFALCISNLGMSLGLGFSCMILLSIPVVKLIIPPIAVIAGTMLFAKIWVNK